MGKFETQKTVVVPIRTNRILAGCSSIMDIYQLHCAATLGFSYVLNLGVLGLK